MSQQFKRVTSKELRTVKAFSYSKLQKLQHNLKGKVQFQIELVGSVAFSTCLKDEKGSYDLDFNLVLQKNYDKNINEVQRLITEELEKVTNKNQTVKTRTSVNTIVSPLPNEPTFDIAITKRVNDMTYILVKNKDGSYIWNEKGYKEEDLNNKLSKLSNEQKTDLIENYVLPEKANQMKNNPDKRKKSFIILYEQTNNYWSNKHGKSKK